MIRYRTVAKEATAEQLIEKSRFIAHVKPVETREEAEAFFREIRSLHRNATHNVPAFLLGEKREIQWASDDGEPSGTSGVPVLQMMDKEGITNAAIVITRYFGGIKLGTGGLVRAYTSTAKLGLAAAGICTVQERSVLEVQIGYNHLRALQNSSEDGRFQILEQAFSDSVALRLTVEPEDLESLFKRLSDLTGGQEKILSNEKVLVKI